MKTETAPTTPARKLKLCYMGEMTPDELESFCKSSMNDVVSQEIGNGNLNVWIMA